jgi:hypothetical protein
MIFLCVEVEKGVKRGTAARSEVVDCRDSLEVNRIACAEMLLVATPGLAVSRSWECRSRPVRAIEAMFATGDERGESESC